MNYKLLWQMEKEQNESLKNYIRKQKIEINNLEKFVSILKEENKHLESELNCTNKIANRLEKIVGNIITPDKTFNHTYA